MRGLAWIVLLLATGCRFGGGAGAAGDPHAALVVDPVRTAVVPQEAVQPDVPALWHTLHTRAEAAEHAADGEPTSTGFEVRPELLSESLARSDYSMKDERAEPVSVRRPAPLNWAQRFLRSMRPWTAGQVRRWIDDADPAYAEQLLRLRGEEHRFELDYLSASIVGGVSFAGRARFGNDSYGMSLQGDADWDIDLAGERARFGPRFDVLLPVLDNGLEFEAAYSHEMYSGVGTLSIWFKVRYW
ncbi:MAG: hypothetical protein ACYTGN_08040 [Planctomycetota bacterium]